MALGLKGLGIVDLGSTGWQLNAGDVLRKEGKEKKDW